jgi:hypothetical protein
MILFCLFFNFQSKTISKNMSKTLSNRMPKSLSNILSKNISNNTSKSMLNNMPKCMSNNMPKCMLRKMPNKWRGFRHCERHPLMALFSTFVFTIHCRKTQFQLRFFRYHSVEILSIYVSKYCRYMCRNIVDICFEIKTPFW